ncbi:replication-relaxation family protein [Kribbella sp. CA-294648]|uniref:replication-relaxation family protein n=1 Tax=Kribbella sp. CA-294648 TaxID=3239948 RepID=UPI003D93DC9D
MTDFPHNPELRIARPVASSNDPHTRRSDARAPRLSVRNSSPISDAQLRATHPSKQRTGHLDLASLRHNLSPRDLAILRSISAHRFLTTRHVRVLHFSDHASELSATRSSNRVLRRLSRDKLIAALDRRVGGVRAGSAGYVWRVTAAAYRLLQTEDGEGISRRYREPSQRLLAHTLAIADTHVALNRAASSDSLELVTVQVEPGSWRRFLGIGGESRLLRPDLAVVTAQAEYEDHWFIEVDLGTEHPPTVIRKCHLYEDYRRSGNEQDAHGLFPRVLWVVPNQQRADKLTTAITEAKLDPALFRVVTTDQLIPAVIGGAA